MSRLWVRGIRGAAPVSANTPQAIWQATKELLTVIVDKNNLKPERIISAIFSLTPDLNAAFPAAAARELGWVHVPLFDTTEIAVPWSSPEVCACFNTCLSALFSGKC